MKDFLDRDLEGRLRALPAARVPEGLRDRVLAAARSHRAKKAWATPRQRLRLAAGAAGLLFVFAADAFVSHAQRTRLVALSGSRGPAVLRSNDERDLLAEVLGNVSVPRLEAAALGSPEPRGTMGRRRPEPRVRFASSISEDPEIEGLTEDPHDRPKNLH